MPSSDLAAWKRLAARLLGTPKAVPCHVSTAKVRLGVRMGSGAVVGYCGVVEERAGRSRWSAISGLSFVFGGLLSCEGSEAPGEFIWRGGEARLDGVVGDVTAMVGEAVRVVHSMIGEAA